METVFLLLVLFQVKHFISDYPLQNTYMLGKMKLHGWFIPLLAHSSVHAIGTFIIVAFWNIELAMYLAIVELFLHFLIDRIKASPNMLGRFNPQQPYFWWTFGIDQMAHHLINYAFIYIIITKIA